MAAAGVVVAGVVVAIAGGGANGGGGATTGAFAAGLINTEAGVGAGDTAGAGAGRPGSATRGGWGTRTVACSTARVSLAGGRRAAGHNSRTWSNSDARTA